MKQSKLVTSLFLVSTGLLLSALALADHNQGQNQSNQTSQTAQVEQSSDQYQDMDQYVDVTQQDDSEKNICYIIGENYYKCARASRYCFWDSEDGRCEPLNDTSYCGRLGYWSCTRTDSCFWDTEDGRCETVN